MLQQFLRTASDGWDSALASVRNLFAEADLHADEVGGDFAGEAARLGEALAEVHQTLAEHFPTDVAHGRRSRPSWPTRWRPGSTPRSTWCPSWRRTPTACARRSPRSPTWPGVAGAAGPRRPPPRPDAAHVKGWKIVDFEGEPAKPLAERVLPDSPWRDVAGMLRSFDYAPRVAERTVGQGADDTGAEQRAYRAAEWAERNCAAFLEAYAGRDLTADEQALLDAYVADKAVYEAVYEARNRPTWLPIPLAAIERLAG